MDSLLSIYEIKCNKIKRNSYSIDHSDVPLLCAYDGHNDCKTRQRRAERCAFISHV